MHHNLPLDRPLHGGVSGNERGDEVQDLVPRAAHDVPEALADEVRHGALSVGAERVGDCALAGSATALIGVAPGANVPSASRQRAAQLTAVVCAKCAGFCAMDGVPRAAEEMCDCGRAGRTYVALTFALGSEPPPAIVRCVCGWWEVRLGWWVDVGKSSRRCKAQDASRKKLGARRRSIKFTAMVIGCTTQPSETTPRSQGQSRRDHALIKGVFSMLWKSFLDLRTGCDRVACAISMQHPP